MSRPPELDLVGSIVHWLEIREGSGQPLPASYGQFVDEVRHSALLRRLLTGMDPLKTPPPRSYGQPWYSLIESGHATGCDLKPLKDRLGAVPKVAINECAWTLLHQFDDGSCVVQFSPQMPRFRARPCPPPSTGWELERYDPPQSTPRGAIR